MRQSSVHLFRQCRKESSNPVQIFPKTSSDKPPIIRIENATFFRQRSGSIEAPTLINPPLFPKLTFDIASHSSHDEHWAIIGPSSSGKTTFLQILRGHHLCIPATARGFPYLSTDELALKDPRLRSPPRAIQYVGFSGETGGLGGQGTRGAYLSARYESRKEATDFSLLDYLKGHTELNSIEENSSDKTADQFLAKVVKDLRLQDLVDFPVGNLSNGQTRRARIAKAVLGRPEVLLLDEPFSK
jgi:ATPase subunit of ABC transporter with duplicated ATPase domains